MVGFVVCAKTKATSAYPHDHSEEGSCQNFVRGGTAEIIMMLVYVLEL